MALVVASLMASACTFGAEDAAPNESLSEGTLEARGAYFESIVEALPWEPIWQRVVTDEEVIREEYGAYFESSYRATRSSVDEDAFREEVLTVIAVLEAAGFEGRHHQCNDRLINTKYLGVFAGEDESVIRVEWGGIGDGADSGSVLHLVFEDGRSQSMDDTNILPRPQPEFCL